MEQQVNSIYSKAIQLIKSAILKSRYRAATLANRELLSLYYGIGKYISENSRQHFWGTNAIETISKQLQQELPGLRGFSISNLKNMRQFYEVWEHDFVNRQSTTGEIRVLTMDEIETDLLTINRQLATGDLQLSNIEHFLSIGFTHHYEILAKTNSLEERLLYSVLCYRILER